MTTLRQSALVESRCGQRANKMRFGKLGLLHFIILFWARTLCSPFDGVEGKNKVRVAPFIQNVYLDENVYCKHVQCLKLGQKNSRRSVSQSLLGVAFFEKC